MSPSRKIVVHYHLFKNAGTSVERALRQLFGDTLYQLETGSPGGILQAEEAEAFIDKRPDLRALTSHQLRPPLPQGDYALFPILLVREPLVRARSAYLFEWQKQLGLNKPKGTFAEYVRAKLARPGPSVIANYQTTHIAAHLPGAGDKTSLQHVDMALDFLDGLAGFGLVDRYSDSIEMINRRLAAFLGTSSHQLEARHDNITQEANAPEHIHKQMFDELGRSLFDELAQRNHLDSMLYRLSADLFNERFDAFSARRDPGQPQSRRSSHTPTGEINEHEATLRRMARRIRWQDATLADIESTRRAELERLRQSESKLAKIEHQLNVTRALALLDATEHQPPKNRATRRSPLQNRLSRLAESPSPRTSSLPVDNSNNEQLRLIAESGLFDPDAYLDDNPDLTRHAVNPLHHYWAQGGIEGRAASRQFDSQAYLDASPDVVAAGMNPLVHYLLHGRHEGRPATTVSGSLLIDIGHDLSVSRPRHHELESICNSLSFPTHIDVDASIVIPVYNQIDYTVACIESLASLDTRYRFEVIVMDDCSTESAATLLAKIRGVRYIRNDTNLGFLRTCNRSSDHARGRFLVLVNSDATVEPRWLDELLDTFSVHDNVGLVGSKLVYPGGHLQEAGGVVFQDASGWNYGKNDPADHPRYNYLRDVDYCSAASVAIERAYFDELGRFDEQFAPAYYEDTDLCFKVRDDGRRVLYQPSSVATHHEGVSCGTDVTSGVKRYQQINRDKFLAKWHDELVAHHFTGSLSLPEAADRMATGHVLIVNAEVPTPDRDSGSIDMFNLIHILSQLGLRVHYVPVHGFGAATSDVQALQRLGVSVATEPHYSSLDAYLNDHNDRFDTVILSRATVAKDAVHKVLAACPSANTIFYTVDLHFLRLRREAELRNDRDLRKQAEQFEEAELRVIDLVDTTIVLSQFEKELLADMGRDNVEVIPLIRQTRDGPVPGYDARDGVVFIGGFRHPPNIDAITWLLDDIWPEVRRVCKNRGLPPIPLRVIGGDLPDHLRVQADDVEIYGYVENLEPVFKSTLVSVAPLRYGAGLKGKVATSLGYGVPVVATAAAVEGVPTTPAIVAVDETREAVATAIVDLVTDRQSWEHRSSHGTQFVRQYYSIDAVRPLVAKLLLGPSVSQTAVTQTGLEPSSLEPA